ncbi:MAG: hypothetical protein H7A43_11090 [Verrucomicrobia bacterium]|nr:hypothetical protein [Kiritimatiellia bacterium]MCP5489178.1 hypothetical protein [Verrucomicrobiota bacterium]
MHWGKPQNPVDRRRRELEAEEAQIRRRMKEVLKSTPKEVLQKAATLAQASAEIPPDPSTPATREETARAARSANLAHYLSSGSFGGGSSDVPMSYDRKVQRNKMIFLALLLLLGLFILVQIFS